MQARMGSSRLPGKVLLKAGGKTFLEHAFERLQMARTVDQCVVATTTENQDDVLSHFCKSRGWLSTRGPEQDVLTRYYQAARRFPADIIVRVTADCPLLDPDLIDQVVELLICGLPDLSYASNVLEPRHFPRGLDVEAFTFSALEEAWSKANHPSDREHVTPFLRNHPENFPQNAIHAKQNSASHRWTLDTPEDQQLLTRILDCAPEPAPWKTILSLVETNPEWSELNAKIRQKEQ